MDNRVARKRQRLFRYAVDLFVQLLKQVTGRKNIKYLCNDSDTACWRVFVDTFSERIGENFVRKFCEYGIQSWFNDGAEKDYSHSVRFSWIFGKAAIERWKKNDIRTNEYIIRSGLKTNYKINTIRKSTNVPKIVNELRVVEEKFKSNYYNTRRGFAWCIANTTLYFHKSSLCAACIYKDICKKTLEQEYPKVYIKRGYAKR